MPGERLDMTREEMERISEALKKEEFRKLLADYAEELADPEKRRLYEEELTMLESQRGVDMKFIKPTPGFVIKLNDSNANKVFINVCTSKEIAAPEFTYAEKKGEGNKVEKGQQCSLPYSLAPSHPEKDNKNVECDVFDVVFNPEVLARCNNPKFKDMVVDTAIDGVTSNFKVQLDRDSKKFPKMKFKGTPSSTVIRKRVAEEQAGAFDHLPTRPDFPDVPGENKKKEEKKKKEDEKKKKPDDEPEYKIVFREDVNMGKFTNDRVTGSGRPTQLIVTISLPQHPSAKGVDLDVYPDFLELHSKHYHINHLKLPYKVDSDNGKAKFDKEKRELVVTLDTLPQEIDAKQLSNFPESSLVEEIAEDSTNSTESDIPEDTTDSIQTMSTDTNSIGEVQHQNGVEPEYQAPSIETLSDTVTENGEETTKSVNLENGKVEDAVMGEVKENGIVQSLQAAVNDIDTPSSEVSSIEMIPSIDSCNSEMSDTSSNSIEGNLAESLPCTLPEVEDSESATNNTLSASSESDSSFKPIVDSPPESEAVSPGVDESSPEIAAPSAESSPITPGDVGAAKLVDVKITVDDKPCGSPSTQSPQKFRSRFNVSPVPCSEGICNAKDPKVCKDPVCVEKEDFENRDLTMPEEGSSVNSGLSSYTDCSLEENLNVAIRVFQDMSTATVLLDTVYNNVPEVTLSGKKVWLKNEDVSLYLILPHTITTYTIHMSHDNVCFVVYKQHKSLWSAMHIGHSEEEVYSFKFITEENADNLVESIGDPWQDDSSTSVCPRLVTTDSGVRITYDVGTRPSDIPIPYSPDSEGDDPALKGILKSPHSPPPSCPRSRKVSFNEEVETFVLPSKRSIKGKKRRKNKGGNGSSASESSDEASSPSPTSPIDRDVMLNFSSGDKSELPTSEPEGLVLESADSGWSTAGSGKKNKRKGKNNKGNDKEGSDKENVVMTQGEAVKILDPTGSASHKMMLGNPHIYELED